MSYQLNLASLFNLAAVGLGGLAVYKMLTVSLGKPSQTPVVPIAFDDKLFLERGDSFDTYWELWTRRENRHKLKGATVYFLRLEGMGPDTWGVRFDTFPQYFLIDGMMKDDLIANAKLYEYHFVTK